MGIKHLNTKKAVNAQNKKANLGLDIDLSKFKQKTSEVKGLTSLEELQPDIAESARGVGIVENEDSRSGSFFQVDSSVVFSCHKREVEGLEVLSTQESLKRYDWLKDYYYKVVEVDADKYTFEAHLQKGGGYFIRAKSGVKLTLPVQACLFIGTEGLLQAVHNIIIAEEGSELHIITGCTTHPLVSSGMHIGISEFYIKKGATVTFTMIHSWAEDVDVRPRTGVIIETGGRFISNYICRKPVRSLQMYPVSYCVGEGARVRYHTLIYGSKNSSIDVGGRIVLSAKDCRAEITSRIIAKDQSQITARGHLIGEKPETKAHLDCRGLLLSDTASIHSIPELSAKAQGCELSHEATVGKIEEDQLCYLMSRGLTCDEATALIIRGFLDPEIPGLPIHLKQEIRKTIELISEKAM
ncbi:MAG: SufD family Fe-S cluster assembly protein [bacterium]|nr:SufD family Fe-S cluster assembly protein [bacterium]